MFKNIIYINIVFLFTLVSYFFAQNYGIKYFSNFYLLFSLFCIASSLVLISSDLNFKDQEEREVYSLFFIGLLVYGVGNFVWFLNTELFEDFISDKFLNLIFCFQTITKFYLFKYLFEETEKRAFKKGFLDFYILFILILLFFGTSIVPTLFEYFFIFDSIVTIYYSLRLLNYQVLLIDLNYFITASSLWLFADIYYLFLSESGNYFMGNIVDFVYFIGFYLIISSIVYKNFKFSDTFNNIFENRGFYLYN